MVQGYNVIAKIYELIVYPIITVVVAAGFFWFMWGFVQFMWNLRKGVSSSEGKQHMLWGIIGMFIMVSVNGIISLIIGTFGLGDIGNPSANPARNFFNSSR